MKDEVKGLYEYLQSGLPSPEHVKSFDLLPTILFVLSNE